MPQNDIQTAIDEVLSGVEHRPTLRYAILHKVQQKHSARHIRFSPALILTLLLTCIVIGSCAWAYLSARQMTEDTVVPLANESQSLDFSHEDMLYLITLAEENGITLSEYAQGNLNQAMDKEEGYPKSELIRAMAKAEFGMNVQAWSPEEKKWYSDALLAIGETYDSWYTLPEADEISEAHALDAARGCILSVYGQDVPEVDNDIYHIYRAFQESTVAEPHVGRYWTITFAPLTLTADQFSVDIDHAGTILRHSRIPGVKEEMSRDRILDRYEDLYGNQNTWDQVTWRSCLEDMRQYAINNNNSDVGLMCIYQTAYPEVAENAISQAEALRIAMAAVGATEENHRLDGIVYMDHAPHPIWKVGLWVNPGKENVAIYRIEIDSVTGEITHTYQCPDLATRPPIYASHETWLEMEEFVQEWLDQTAVG